MMVERENEKGRIFSKSQRLDTDDPEALLVAGTLLLAGRSRR